MEEFEFSSPTSRDGSRVFDLISKCPPLDVNSMYCNLLQCHHFGNTSVKVEYGGGEGSLAGFISGYLIPETPSTLFVWQVAVAAAARGHNLGGRMVSNILARPVCRSVNTVQTTISPRNDASWGLFKKLAVELGCDYQSELLFAKQEHFGGHHDDEILVTIGPFKPR